MINSRMTGKCKAQLFDEDVETEHQTQIKQVRNDGTTEILLRHLKLNPMEKNATPSKRYEQSLNGNNRRRSIDIISSPMDPSMRETRRSKRTRDFCRTKPVPLLNTSSTFEDYLDNLKESSNNHSN